MVPHPEMTIKITALRYQEQLDEAALQRRALSFNPGARARPTLLWSRGPAAVDWLRQLVRGATRAFATSLPGRRPA
jgi:hypothetical protein